MPDDDTYRKQAHDKVQNLISGRHEKSTSKLFFEAVVEGFKLYRGYKKEQAAEEREEETGKGEGKHKRHSKEEGMEESGKDGHKRHRRHGHGHNHEQNGRHRNRHRSRSRDEERGKHRHSSQDERRSRSRRRHRDESRGRHHGRSRTHEKRSKSRRRHRDSDIRDPVIEHAPNDDSEYQMTGGAGPAGTLHDGHRKPNAPLPGDDKRPGSGASGYQTSWQDLVQESRSPSRSRGRKRSPSSRKGGPTPHRSARKASKDRSRVRSRSRGREDKARPGQKRSYRQNSKGRSTSRRRNCSRTNQTGPRPGQVGASRSPTRQKKGPDGTLFGSLPTYKKKAGIAFGLGDHFVNTYKHVKAEHDAGHRTKGMLETKVDEMRKKKPDAKGSSDKRKRGQTREREKVRKNEPERVRWAERYPGKTRGEEWKPAAAETEAWERHRRDQEERRRRDKGIERRREEEKDRKRNRSSPIPEIRVQPPTYRGSPRRPPPSTARGMSHPTAPDYPPPSTPGLPIRNKISYKREVSPPREPSIRGADDRSEGGATASYYNQTPHSPIPGSYENHGERERGGDYHEPAVDEVPGPDIRPSPLALPYPNTPPSPAGSESGSGSSSLIMSHAPRAPSPSPRSTPEFLQSMPVPQQPAPPVLHPPPPPPLPASALPLPPLLPAARPPNNTGIAAMLGAIRGPPKLRKVAASDKKDSSLNPKAGRVLHNESSHNHDAEEHERAQAREANNHSPVRGNSTWSTAYSLGEEPDARPEPNRAFKNKLSEELNARNAGSSSGTNAPSMGPRRVSDDTDDDDDDDSSLTAGSRTSSMIANVSRKLHDEQAPYKRLSRSESGGDMVFTLAAHIARPGWGFDGLSGDEGER